MIDFSLASRIFDIVFPVFAIVMLGFVYGKFRHQDMSAVNHILVDVIVPILIFVKLVEGDFSIGKYVPLAIACALLILGTGAVLWPLVKKFSSTDPKTFVPPMIFSNATNVGIPLQIFAFGDSAMPAALILVLVFNLLHFSVGIYILDHGNKWYNTLKQPILIASLAAIIFKSAGASIPDFASIPMNMVADVCIPLMLFSLGMRLVSADTSALKLGITGGLLAPIASSIVALLIILVIPMPYAHKGNLLLFAALPPAVMNFILAEKFNQEPNKVASIVMIGNAMAIVTIPIALAFILPYFDTATP